MTKKYFLGVDVGGTKTHALIADERGTAIGFGTGGPGNWQAVGFDGQRSVLRDVTRQVLTLAGVRVEQISGAGFGIAGYDWPSQLEPHLEVIQSLGLKCPLEVTNDAVIALMAGASQGWGIGIVAGTGNNCRGRDKNGREGRITGEGMRFGEFGGGAEIVMKAIHAVAYEWTQRGPSTVLSKTFMEITGAKDLLELIEGIDLARYAPDASWALGIFQAAYAGDEVARKIVEWSGRELGESACAVIRQLNIEHEEFEVVLAGSIFAGGDLYINPLQNTIHKLAPKAKLVKLEAPPVIGGVVLGMQKADIVTVPIHRNLTETATMLFAEKE
ncbi:MAG: ATPase [Chloroflexi bacterium]|nr:ATPase [Chloroflexota bacterium]